MKPRWFGWDRDFITWSFVYGEAAGGYAYSGGGSSISLVSNYTTALAATATGAANIHIRPVVSWGGSSSYQHQWTPNLRSNIGIGLIHYDINTLSGAVGGGVCPFKSAGVNTGAAGCGLNKEMLSGIANVIWSPVPFVDIGLEYLYGHRMTIANQRGDENVLESRFRVRF